MSPDAHGGTVWFAFDDSRPLAVFAGVWCNWTCVRKIKEGETTNDLFGFLTTEPNDVVAPVHPKAMPVILTKPEEIEIWMTAPTDEALKFGSDGVKNRPPTKSTATSNTQKVAATRSSRS